MSTVWWETAYPALSLRDLSLFPLFQRLFSHHQPYHKVSATAVEHLWYIDNCKIVEWYDSQTHMGEKAGVDRNSDTLFYEAWDAVRLIKTWKNDKEEWGEVREKTTGRVETWHKAGTVSSLEIHTPTVANTTIETLHRSMESQSRKKVTQSGASTHCEEQYHSKDHQETREWMKDSREEWGREEISTLQEKTVFTWKKGEEERQEIREKWVNGDIAERVEIVTKGEAWRKTEWHNWRDGDMDTTQPLTEISQYLREVAGKLACHIPQPPDLPHVPLTSLCPIEEVIEHQKQLLDSLLSALTDTESTYMASICGLVSHLSSLVKESTCTNFPGKSVEQSCTSLSEYVGTAVRLCTQIHIELNTLRRNQATMTLLIEKLLTFAGELMPDAKTCDCDFGERLARTMEGLVSVEKAVRLVRKKSEGPEEMEEFPDMLRKCFLIGFEVLAKAAALHPLDSDNPALELLRSTKWIRESVPSDSNTNRQMLVNFLHSALLQSLSLLPRPALSPAPLHL